jgi:hypothetical protein
VAITALQRTASPVVNSAVRRAGSIETTETPHSAGRGRRLASASTSASIPPARGYRKVALYPEASPSSPSAPRTTSATPGRGTNRPIQAVDSSEGGTVQSLVLYGTMKLRANPVPR